jgi:hypothetical protein
MNAVAAKGDVVIGTLKIKSELSRNFLKQFSEGEKEKEEEKKEEKEEKQSGIEMKENKGIATSNQSLSSSSMSINTMSSLDTNFSQISSGTNASTSANIPIAPTCYSPLSSTSINLTNRQNASSNVDNHRMPFLSQPIPLSSLSISTPTVTSTTFPPHPSITSTSKEHIASNHHLLASVNNMNTNNNIHRGQSISIPVNPQYNNNTNMQQRSYNMNTINSDTSNIHRDITSHLPPPHPPLHHRSFATSSHTPSMQPTYPSRVSTSSPIPSHNNINTMHSYDPMNNQQQSNSYHSIPSSQLPIYRNSDVSVGYGQVSNYDRQYRRTSPDHPSITINNNHATYPNNQIMHSNRIYNTTSNSNANNSNIRAFSHLPNTYPTRDHIIYPTPSSHTMNSTTNDHVYSSTTNRHPHQPHNTTLYNHPSSSLTPSNSIINYTNNESTDYRYGDHYVDTNMSMHSAPTGGDYRGKNINNTRYQNTRSMQSASPVLYNKEHNVDIDESAWTTRDQVPNYHTNATYPTSNTHSYHTNHNYHNHSHDINMNMNRSNNMYINVEQKQNNNQYRTDYKLW